MLLKLTDKLEDKTIFVNPDKIFVYRPMDSGTTIFLATASGLLKQLVSEDMATILDQLNSKSGAI